MRLGDLDHLLLKLDAELSDDARYIDIADQINAMVEYEKLKHMKELVEQFNQSLEDLQGGEL